MPSWIVYDGDCPFCSEYVRLTRLNDAAGPVHLVNARDGGPVVADVRARGFDLNQGMVLILGNRYYGGADCVHMMALISSRVGLLNRLLAYLFSNKIFAAALYPVLRTMRSITLAILGRTQIPSQF